MEVDVLAGDVVGGGVVACATEHGEDNGEGVGWVGEGDVEDGRAVYEGVDGLVVVGAWGIFYLFLIRRRLFGFGV